MGGVLGAPFDRVGSELRCRCRRQNLRATGKIFFQHVVLQVDDVIGPGKPLLFAKRGKQREDEGSDRIAQGADALDAVQWDAGKQGLDVGERIDRYADPADLASRYDM